MPTIPLLPQYGPTPNFIVSLGASSVWELATNYTATEMPLICDEQTVVSNYGSEVDERPIVDLNEDGYVVFQPIPIKIERTDDTSFLATFQEANIAMVGVDRQDAYQSLVAEILDTFDVLTGEGHLGPDAAAQLQVLRTYIGKA